MKVLIAAGGTGGHVYPALSIANKFREEGHDVKLVGRANSFEEKIFKENNFNVLNIHSAQFYFSPKAFIRFLSNALLGLFDSFKIMNDVFPDIVIGGGGYVSAPILLSALLLKKPFFVYEQNIIPGRTNRIFGRYARKVFTGFPDIYNYFPKEKVVFSGNPVRKSIFSVSKEEALSFFNFSDGKFTLLVFGGSGGSQKINFTFARILMPFYEKTHAQIIFITGKRDFKNIKNMFTEDLPLDIKIIPYLDEMEYALKVSDFAVARGGAMTLTELALSGIPAIIIPFPYARDDHQYKNAIFLKKQDCGMVVREEKLSDTVLLSKLIYYFEHQDIIKKMSNDCKGIFDSDAADKIYRGILNSI
jgi:UDP-N-acetylglucosamine--N-acetylmuramyl-(pentapeptide) pyrophosphoryl-undecaprenol N-acetylglucosamine transferase